MTGGILIVGASLAGLRLAEQLRAAGYSGALTLVGAEPHMPYNRPPLSKDVLLGDTGFSDALARLTFSIRPTLRDLTWRLGSAAVAADLKRQTVTLADGSVLCYDGLAIATGLTPRRLPLPGADASRHVVRTIDDAITLRDALKPGTRVVVAGGGFIGCEAAATASARGCDVSIVESLAAPMIRAIGEPLARAMQAFHESKGVRFHFGRSIAGLTCAPSDPQRLTSVELSDGTPLGADILIEAIGSISNSAWLDGNGLDLSDGVLTDNTMRVPGFMNVVAAGDVARFAMPRYGSTARRIEHWAIPSLTAKRAAESLSSHLLNRAADGQSFNPLPTFWSDQFGVRLQSMGMPGLADRSAVLDGALTNIGRSDTPGVAVGYWRDDALVGVLTIGMPVSTLSDYRNRLA